MDAKRKRQIAACILITYTAIVVQFVVFKAAPVLHIGHLRLKFSGTHTGPGNFIPFKTIWPSLHGLPNRLIAIVELAGNIVPFVPIGFLASIVLGKTTWLRALGIAIATGLLMEGMEMVFRVGIFDVDDVILNALGVMIGYWLHAMLMRKERRQTSS